MNDTKLAQSLQFLGVNVTAQDIQAPDPDRLLVIFRAYLMKVFDMPDHVLNNLPFGVETSDMETNGEIYSRAVPILVITQLLTAVLGDYADISRDELNISSIVVPTTKNTRRILTTLADVYNFKQKFAPFLQEKVDENRAEWERIQAMEEKEGRLLAERKRLEDEKGVERRKENKLREVISHLERDLKVAEEESEALDMEGQREDQELYSINEQMVGVDGEIASLRMQIDAITADLKDCPSKMKEELEQATKEIAEMQKAVEIESREHNELLQKVELSKQVEKMIEGLEVDASRMEEAAERVRQKVADRQEAKSVREEAETLVSRRRVQLTCAREEAGRAAAKHEEDRRIHEEKKKEMEKENAGLRGEGEALKGREGGLRAEERALKTQLQDAKSQRITLIRQTNAEAAKKLQTLQACMAKLDHKNRVLDELQSQIECGREKLATSLSTQDFSMSHNFTLSDISMALCRPPS